MQVQAFINRSEKSDITATPASERVVPPQPGDPDHDGHDAGGHGSTDPLNVDHHGDNDDSLNGNLPGPNDGVIDSRVFAALGDQLREALNDKQKLADELQIERVKNSQLENQVAIGMIFCLYYFKRFVWQPGLVLRGFPST